jgi:hypothetical protein
VVVLAASTELGREGSEEGGYMVRWSGVGERWPGAAGPWITNSSLRTISGRKKERREKRKEDQAGWAKRNGLHRTGLKQKLGLCEKEK